MGPEAFGMLKVIYRMDMMMRNHGKFRDETLIRKRLSPGRISYNDLFQELVQAGFIERRDLLTPRHYRLTQLGREEVRLREVVLP